MPATMSVRVIGAEASVCDSPKSVIFTTLPGATMMLDGLMSRCTSPAECAACRPAAAWARMSIARAAGSGPARRIWARVGPSTNSITR